MSASTNAVVPPAAIALAVADNMGRDWERAARDSSDVARLALMVPDPELVPAVLRDPGDDYLVELARANGAEAIITGDSDLLEHEGLVPPALRAREACVRVGLI